MHSLLIIKESNMKESEIKKLAELRNYIIGFYNSLSRESPGVSVTKTSDVAYFCESVVNSADDILKPYVSFGEK